MNLEDQNNKNQQKSLVILSLNSDPFPFQNMCVYITSNNQSWLVSLFTNPANDPQMVSVHDQSSSKTWYRLCLCFDSYDNMFRNEMACKN